MDNFTKIKELMSVSETFQRKARIYAEEKAVSKGQMNDFRASEGWLEKFMPQNGLSLCHCTTQALKTTEQITDKVILYIIDVCQSKKVTTTWIALWQWMKQLCGTK